MDTKHVMVPGANDNNTGQKGGNSISVTMIVLGRNVTKISKGAFKNCRSANSLVVQTKN